MKPSVLATLVVSVALSGRLSAQSGDLFLPDTSLSVTYEQAAHKNVLAAVNPAIFTGYWSVCADGHGFGYGNTYPSLDGHQMSDALLWLDQARVVRANWDYVRSFQRSDGLLPLAILPASAGKDIGPKGFPGVVSPNGGLYVHWVPGNPLEALASPTYIQNADVIYRATLDTAWLFDQLPSVNLAADFLASLTSDSGAVRGGGYYVERPPRLDWDGVTQCYAVDAFERVAALNRVAGNDSAASRYAALAGKIRRHFQTAFWVGDHFAEYISPSHGKVAGHGYTDVDWAAIATGVATGDQRALLWPLLKDNEEFHYGGVPAGIATHPERYENWEFNYDRHDVAAMGRVWYLEAWARAGMDDADGLLAGLRAVSRLGRDSGYYWRERFVKEGESGYRGIGPNTYCEYPANYIRIMQRFLLGVDMRLDGSLVLAPCATPDFWEKGFGQTLRWRNRTLRYTMRPDRIEGVYRGKTDQKLGVYFPPASGRLGEATVLVWKTLPATGERDSCVFRIPRSVK